MASPILWQNKDATTVLIDVPHSIAVAQNSKNTPIQRHLVSTVPSQSPFSSNEPKSASAKAKLERNTVDATLHASYRQILEQAVEDATSHHGGLWCLPRPFTEEQLPAKKHKLDEEQDHVTPDLGSSLKTLGNQFFSNDTDQTVPYKLTSLESNQCLNFHIPPGACFYLGDCVDAKAFHAAVRSHAEKNNTKRSFDCIILDPPWPNRSVKRTHKTVGSTYTTSPSLWDLRELLLDTKLDLLMTDDCLVAMWITNKPAVREIVLGEDGIFACWGVGPVEEWLWLKTTIDGEPVSPLDALWRKPYETLVLGRKRRQASGNPQAEHTPTEVKRRVLISVPDLHSRKPCLKELIEPLMEDSKNYRALEVFARHLVAGWWSWGDECIKFNWEGFWRTEDET